MVRGGGERGGARRGEGERERGIVDGQKGVGRREGELVNSKRGERERGIVDDLRRRTWNLGGHADS